MNADAGHAEPAQKGYLYAELDIFDADYFYREYMPRVRPVLEQFGARFLVAMDNPVVVEGERVVKRVIFLEFDSPARAREFYDSQAYQAVIGYRLDSSRAHLYLLDGVAVP